MKINKGIGFIFLLLLVVTGCGGKSECSDATCVVPVPESVELKRGNFAFSRNTTYASDGDMYAEVLSDFSDLFEKSAGFVLRAADDVATADVCVETDESLPEEAYTLSVTPQRILIKASGEGGILCVADGAPTVAGRAGKPSACKRNGVEYSGTGDK